MARHFIIQHFEKALQRGWIAYFAQAALKHDFPLALLMAIASRETNMTNMKGDFRKSKHFPNGGYHGYGIMQVDVGTDPSWIASGAWQQVDQAIMRGTGILAGKRDQLNNMWQGSRTLKDFLWVLAASYNHGTLDSYRDFKNEGSPDGDTTGHDYGKDVMTRMQEFAELLAARGITATSYAVQGFAALPQTQPASVTSPAASVGVPPASTGAGVVIQSGDDNTVDSGATPQAVAGGGAADKPVTLSTTAPVKSGGVKAILAAIFAAVYSAIQFFNLEAKQVFGYAKDSFSDSPLGTVGVIIFALSGMAIYWKYQDRQTKLDLQREQNAHDRDMMNAKTFADPKLINVEIKPPVPESQKVTE
jgi:hypothetical protein